MLWSNQQLRISGGTTVGFLRDNTNRMMGTDDDQMRTYHMEKAGTV
jgi:hypothetical protein